MSNQILLKTEQWQHGNGSSALCFTKQNYFYGILYTS